MPRDFLNTIHQSGTAVFFFFFFAAFLILFAADERFAVQTH